MRETILISTFCASFFSKREHQGCGHLTSTILMILKIWCMSRFVWAVVCSSSPSSSSSSFSYLWRNVFIFFRSAVGHLNYMAVCSTEVCSLVSLSVLQTHTCYIFETDGAVRKIHKLISSWPEGKQAGFICSVLRQTVPTWARMSHSRCVCLPPACTYILSPS